MLPAILGGLKKQTQAQPAGGAAPGGGLPSMIDLHGDGNPLDDILKMAGKLT